MSNALYTQLASDANSMLAEFGQEVVLTRRTTTYNPSTGTSAPTETTQTGVACIFDYPVADINGVQVQVGDKQCFLSAKNISMPKVDDELTLASSQTFHITAVKATSPAGVPVLYEVNLRGQQ